MKSMAHICGDHNVVLQLEMCTPKQQAQAKLPEFYGILENW